MRDCNTVLRFVSCLTLSLITAISGAANNAVADGPQRLELALDSVNAVLVEADKNGAELTLSGLGLEKTRAFKVEKPLSIVVDIPGHAQEHPELHSFPGTLVKAVRVLSYKDNLKLVLDLSASVDPEVSREADSVVVKIGSPSLSSKPEDSAAAAPNDEKPEAGEASAEATPEVKAEESPAEENKEEAAPAAVPEPETANTEVVPGSDIVPTEPSTIASPEAASTPTSLPSADAKAADAAPADEIVQAPEALSAEAPPAPGAKPESQSGEKPVAESMAPHADVEANSDAKVAEVSGSNESAKSAQEEAVGGRKSEESAPSAPGEAENKEEADPAQTPAAEPTTEPLAALKPAPVKKSKAANIRPAAPTKVQSQVDDPFAPQSLKTINFEFKDAAAKSGAIVRLSLAKRPEFQFSKKNAKTYVLSLKDCSVPVTLDNLPFFPPESFSSFTMVQARQNGQNAEISIGTETPIRLAYSVRGSEILLSEAQKPTPIE